MKFKHLEIAVATIVLSMALFSLLGSVNQYITGYPYSDHFYNSDEFAAKGLNFNYFYNYFIPFFILYTSVYSAVLWIACGLPDKYIGRQQWGKVLLSIIGGIIVFWGLLVLQDCLLHAYKDNVFPRSLYPNLCMAVGVSAVVFIYEIFKHFFILLLQRDEVKQAWKRNNLTADIIWFAIPWVICVIGLIVFRFHRSYTYTVLLMGPCCLLVYLANTYWLIPQYYKKVEAPAFWVRVIMVTLAINIPLNGIYTARATHNSFVFVQFFLLFWILQIVVITPISLYVYSSRQTKKAELDGLQTALGTSNAGLQYLRSQINPHFLFNALNTLYGTALMEKADKTGEGIQKLGDMMRFMLHENNQDRIALSREIDYLHNYIDLQNMRLALSPELLIEIQIEDIIGYYEIAPMLLIPFVENAYKHGVSLQAKSWINVNLYKTDNILHLDVHNSIHPVNAHDPERYHSGTGLDNVKQRLQLMYPGKHELVIRQNAKEFFIHLSITLNTQQTT